MQLFTKVVTDEVITKVSRNRYGRVSYHTANGKQMMLEDILHGIGKPAVAFGPKATTTIKP